jgi:hypothetical protein
MKATEREIQLLNSLYDGRRVFHGELHDHSASGARSDGKRSLSHWRGAMEALQMDFAAILDHHQVRHMYLPEWEDGVFIGGTEPGLHHIVDIPVEKNGLHYNMIFEGPKPLEELLSEFEEFKFTGGPEGEFAYPDFTTARFCELIQAVKEKGGFFVYPHPKQVAVSENPLHYWFCDEIAMEVFYMSMDSQYTVENYALWTDLLALGKRVWASAGCDKHACAQDTALTTIYAEEKKNASYIAHLRVGDFVCGPIGIRMCIGETKMGGKCQFGDRLVISVGDFHRSVKDPSHRYRLDILDENGVVAQYAIGCEETSYFALDTDPARKFYRVEVFDETRDLRIAIGNPIWNSQLL